MLSRIFPSIGISRKENKDLIKRIRNLNFWLIVIFFLFVFGSVLAGEGFNHFSKAFDASIRSTINLMVNIFINLALIRLFIFYARKNNITNKSKDFKNAFLITSYSLNIIAYLIIFMISDYFFSIGEPHAHNKYLFIIFFCFLINSIILSFYGNILLQEEKIKVDLENSKLRAANADTANQLLRQQIHPHFLFNSLNTLKSLYKVDANLGEKYLIHLSTFLRAAVSKNNAKVIPLKDEIKLCHDYVEMQQIRFKKGLCFTVSISDSILKSGFVPSFSIQPLIENAIKHNELTDERPLHIQVNQVNSRIEVINNLQIKKSNEESTGSGLTNLSERYKLIANDEIIINQTTQQFSVSIKILENEYSYN